MPKNSIIISEHISCISGSCISGSRRVQDSESWTLFALCPTTMSNDQILDIFAAPVCGYEGNPGGTCYDRPQIRRTRTRVLMTQRGGWDI